jgi:hypothetical protein
MDCHLNAGLGASALEHHIKPAILVKYPKEAICGFSRSSELFLGRFCLWTRGEAKHVFGKAVSLGKVETGPIDINGDDARTPVRLCKRAGQ